MGVMQEDTGLPFTRTVQAKHWPSPHPYLVPVNCKSSRRTSSKGRRESVVIVFGFPLTVKEMLASIFSMAGQAHSNGSAAGPLDVVYRTS
jgi:hypothetical protein